MPKRIQRRRTKGFKLPENTICVDRTSKWGNPFIVGEFGTKRECIHAHFALLSGYINVVKKPSIKVQQDYYNYVASNIEKLKDKNLACFCKDGEPCHADVLLELANK